MRFEINNVNVYGIAQSIKASGYPMQTEIDTTLSMQDFDRGKMLAKTKAGSGHDCFLKGVTVQADVTASQYWWLQFGRYHFADIVSSQSKMHRITKMKIDKQVNDYVDQRIIEVLKELIETYGASKHKTVEEYHFQRIISSCPMGLMLTARITTNYLQLKSIYNQRRSHKLEEWQQFCDWIESLPFSEWITGQED